MVAAGLLLIVSVATSPVRVVGEGCPSGADVELALASLLTGAVERAAGPDVARLERRPGGLRVELADPGGVVIAERVLDGGASCAELARMAAIVIASWESDVHPEFARQPAEIANVAPPLPPSAPPTVHAAYDLAAGVTLGQVDTLAAGASIGAAWFPRGAGFGLWMLGAGDLARTMTVGTHTARWRRWTASLELARRWARDGLTLDAHGGFTLGWLSTDGVDYAQNRTDSVVEPGATAGIRTAWWISRRAAVWADVRGFYFPRRDSVYGTDAGAPVGETPVPSWGGIASLGVALGRAPVSP